MKHAESDQAITKFFRMLPSDWRKVLLDFWPDYSADSGVYVVQDQGEYLGGGIVFRRVPPESEAWAEQASHWFDRGYVYLGYLWFKPSRRGEGLGSFWLQQIGLHCQASGIWLAIEDPQLMSFYEQNGFVVSDKLVIADKLEYLMAKGLGER